MFGLRLGLRLGLFRPGQFGLVVEVGVEVEVGVGIGKNYLIVDVAQTRLKEAMKFRP